MKILTTDPCLVPTFSAPTSLSPLPLPSSTPPSLPPQSFEHSITCDNCNICDLIVTSKQKGVQCDHCDQWVHTKCEKILDSQYDEYKNKPESNFICKKCRKCLKCERTIANNHRKLKCHTCFKFIHPKCNKMSDKEYTIAIQNEHEFECLFCFAVKFPFSTVSDNIFNISVNDGILNPNNIEVNFTPTEYQKNIFNEISELTARNTTENDDDEEVLPTIDCEYYTCDDFKKKKFHIR